MRKITANRFLLTALLSFFFVLRTVASPPLDTIPPLQWDPGLTHEGTRAVTGYSELATNYYFRITTANPSLGAWRIALKVEEGEAQLYLRKGVLPTPTQSDFRSERVGSDGLVLSSTQFSPNEVWYVLVQATSRTRWSLVSGAPYVQDLGSIAADDSSGSGEVVMGPEGIRFFSTRVPTDILAWRLWLNGATNTIMLKKSSVPLVSGNELIQRGQALVVPPYLTSGQQYFIGIVGAPGTTNRLDSRQQPIVDLTYGANSSTNVTGFPYTTYRVQVPAQQIAWRISAPATAGNPNIALRRNMVPNENNNEALSELAAPLTDNIALVPPVLSDGTFYITVWATNSHQFTLQNGPAVVTDIRYIDSVVNDDPERVGWRYYRVSDINSQLGSLGWWLTVTNHAPGTRIAIRRNAAPGIWNLRNPSGSVSTHHDLISVAQTLQEPGHQADVWYVGVYNPTNALGNFTLQTREIDPGPELRLWQTDRYTRTNVPPGTWEYFRLDLPAGPYPGLGWDLRLQDVTGSPVLVVRKDIFPNILGSGIDPGANWPNNGLLVAEGDWTGRPLPAVGTTNENGRILTLAMGRPLRPGKYYVGVQSTAANPRPISFTLVSRWIGETQEIPVRALNWSGGVYTNTVAPREADYYAVEVPAGLRSLKVRLRTLTGEAMLVAAKDTIPNIGSADQNTIANSTGKNIQKTGNEYLSILPSRGTNVVTPGTYYFAVIGEGQNPPAANRIGIGSSTYVLETLGEMPEPNMGNLGTELVRSGSLAGGDVEAIHFTTDPDVLGFWIFLENRVGNPVAVSRPENDLAYAGLGGLGYPADSYGLDGGPNDGAIAGTTISVANPAREETIMIKARASAGQYPDASYTVRVKRIVPQPLQFDGGVAQITAGDGDRGDYYVIDVPESTQGWDLRITDVLSGNPQLVVCRDYIPTVLGTSQGFSPATATNWFPGEQWSASSDWTERALDANDEPAEGRILAMGMGRPLRPGRYYVGVLNGGGDRLMQYTLVSRGIGSGRSIPITPIAFSGGSSSVAELAPREAAYFSVDIPANTPSWKVQLSTNIGESLLIVSKDTVPNVLAGARLSITNSTGRKMQKVGNEHYLLLPPAGTNIITAGRYYLTVAGEGVGPTAARIGTNESAFTLTSVGAASIRNLGQLGSTDLTESGFLSAGESQIYQFTVPAGTLGIEARLENRTGNPVMVLRGGARAGSAGGGKANIPQEGYGNENGEAIFDVHPNLISTGNITNNIYTLVVMARSSGNTFADASYTLRLNASGTSSLNFDGESLSVTDQAPRTWRYFRVVVPTNAAGWDVRLLDVTNGTPRLVIRRDTVPSVLQTSPWSAPGGATSWPTNAQWMPLMDWTKRNLNATNAAINEEGRVFVCGMGRPLEPGTYYVGVYNNHATAATAYTVLSRGIGEGFTIPIIDLPFTGLHSATLPAREAAYYRVVVPPNAPSWKVKLTGDLGESMMIGLRGFVPNIDMNVLNGTLANGKGMQKRGNEHFVLLPVTGQTNLLPSTNYFAVISEGVNPPGNTRIGTESSSFTFESEGPLMPKALGVVTSEDLIEPDVVEAGETRAYQFLVPSGTLGFKVRLENRAGNPAFVLRYGDRIPDPGSAIPAVDLYGNEGGYTSTEGNTLLYTVPNPVPGIYTLAVKGRPVGTTYTDASYTLRIQEILVPEINFSSELNTNGLSNAVSGALDENERVFFKFFVPATVAGQPVVGWKLDLIQTSGLASMRVRKDTLPSDAANATQMQFTSAAAIIVPPFLTNGEWYVEVKGAGATAFQLTSNPLQLERPAWTMPALGETAVAPGVAAPLFGDSGIGTNGVPLPGDSSTFLEQGTLHYYAVSVPTNNTGILRAVLEAISGNPDAYLRYAAPPTLHHNLLGANGTVYDRSMLADATEYANWVPMDSKVESRLKPGLWYIAIRASDNANARYRLKLSAGTIIDIPAHGPNIQNQVLAGGDWRYYRFTAPSTVPGGFNLNFVEQSGNVIVHIRDVAPPGNGPTGAPADIKDWTDDNKNASVYHSYDTMGTYSFDAPPVRPGATYFFGVRAVTDAVFSIGATTNGVPNVEPQKIAFYGGTLMTNLPPGTQMIYRIDVPAEATRWKHTGTHAAGVQFFLEQGSLPTKRSTDDWRNGSGANHVVNEYLLQTWPWVPGQAYFLLITNATSQAQDVVLAMDGRNAMTDDNDSDALPDAWELQYFSTIAQQNSAGDPDRDGVSNYDEFLQGTNPDDEDSYRARLMTPAIFGSVVRTPDSPTYNLGERVTLTATPAAGYSFVGWNGDASGVANPLTITMDEHKTIGATFKLAGDDFHTALPLSGTSATVTASNVGMSKQAGEPYHAGNPGGKSIWWRWTAPSSGAVTLTTAGTPFNTLLAVYNGTVVSNLTWVASDNASGGTTNRSIVRFNAVAGVTYNIVVDGYNAASSRINLGLTMSGSTGGGTQPTLTNVSRAPDGATQVRISASANQSYAIETSADLVNWTVRGSVTTDAAGTGTYLDTASTNGHNFYRTRQ